MDIFEKEPLHRALQRILFDKGWKQKDLVAASGVPNNTISDIISGKRTNPGWETVQKIRIALGVKMIYIPESWNPDGEKMPIPELLEQAADQIRAFEPMSVPMVGEEQAGYFLRGISKMMKEITEK